MIELPTIYYSPSRLESLDLSPILAHYIYYKAVNEMQQKAIQILNISYGIFKKISVQKEEVSGWNTSTASQCGLY